VVNCLEQLMLNWKDATLEDLGSCDKVVSNKKETTLIGGHGDAEALKLRIEQIKKEIE